MKIDDIVARIDDDECKSIDRFKEDIDGKTSFTITVARCEGVTVEDIRLAKILHESCVHLRVHTLAASTSFYSLLAHILLSSSCTQWHQHTHALADMIAAKCAMTSSLK